MTQKNKDNNVNGYLVLAAMLFGFALGLTLMSIIGG